MQIKIFSWSHIFLPMISIGTHWPTKATLIWGPAGRKRMWLVHRICEQTVWTVWGGNIALKSELWWEMDIGHLPTVLYLVPFALDDIDYCCPRAVKVGAMHCHFLCLCLCLYVGQVMFSHHCDQTSQVAVCSKIKRSLTESVSEWHCHVLSCPQTVLKNKCVKSIKVLFCFS